MWSLPVSGRSGGDSYQLPETILLEEHCHGLASKERHYRLTALFLATKTTNHPISLEAYTTNIPRTAPSDVLDLEFLVSQSLNFEFTVWHAHRALWGIVLDVQSLQPPTDSAPIPSYPELYEQAIPHIHASRLTDAEFIYTPSQIALAAVALVEPDLASRWMEAKHVALNSKTALLSLQSTVEAIKAMITSSGSPPDVEAVREVDRRLRICKNPEKVVGSKAYLLKKAEEERKADEKRNKKAAEVQKAISDGDPFGESLGDASSGGLGLVDYDDDDDDD
ncbi:hypothetical protein HGRIS_007745 [Hohenbuehelia grisea]|uniref:Cyclin C-terminal domain-containing protein n=1 Tax=Hohenbuehelia grisea TaxID=104357 RepID=A0ABR3J672_9AGAR